MKTKIIILICLFTTSGCENHHFKPFTKDLYLRGFINFIEEINFNKFSYSEDEWAKNDTIFLFYSQEWYEKFEPTLSSEEKKLVMALRLKYHAVKLQVAGQKRLFKLESWWLKLTN